MNTFTEQAKAKVRLNDQQMLKKELDCIAILQHRIELDLALGNIDDAIEHESDMLKSLKSIKQMAYNKELDDVVMTTKQYVELLQRLKSVKVVEFRGTFPWG
ncbi:hypothetical protein ACFP7A_01380 [Sporolactobacillus kofuensis]|uniref:Uncharacterized protein n=1 Tax=Sporolactobacillus kofuensis TaxID=269672 RepID=A0ABW1W9N1_9BACL|nr:hypothetical protein [Sporolactobacillus kofuensis]MCO7177047.1 hypothetical protein [Sporolactobacillus kofuensis]